MVLNNPLHFLLSKIHDHDLIRLANGSPASADFDVCHQSYYSGKGTVFDTKVLSIDGDLYWPFGEYSNHRWLQKALPPDTVGILAREPPAPLPNSEVAKMDNLKFELDALCRRCQQIQPHERRWWITVNEIAEKSLDSGHGKLHIPKDAMHELTVSKFRDLALGYTRYNKYSSMRLNQ